MMLASIFISICLPLTASYTSQPTTEAKGALNSKLIRTAKTLQPDDKLLVWIDINATMDRFSNYYLPADPSLYGIKWVTITFDPGIKESELFWCLAEIQARDAEEMLKIPWVFNVTLVRVGGLGNQSSISPKLPLGFQEAMDRTLQHNETLQVIVWMEDSSNSSEKLGLNNEGIRDDIVHNVTAAIEQFEGRLLRDHYEGCHTLSATLPAKSIVRIAENPFVKKLYLDGPVIPEGLNNTARLYGFGKTKGSINLHWVELVFLWSPVVLYTIVMSEKKTKKKILGFLAVAMVLSLTFISHMTPSVQALNVSTSTIRATDVWATGNRGGGINVAVIDTGFDINHNDFQGAINHTINAHDWSNNVGGNEGHGTHVAGIVAGRGVNNSAYRGVAWEAGFVLVKIINDFDFEPAIRWVINNSALHNIQVITMSLGLVNVDEGGDGLESPASIAMDDAVENGIVTIKSAGNIGHQGSRTITSPGNAFNIITVGATNDMNTANMNDDELAYYPNGYTYKGIAWGPWGSSKGPTGDGRPKPDVVAPGVHIWSCRAANSPVGGYEDVSPDGFYGESSGTSMAAPHVAGTVALMLHTNPNLTPAQVKAILRQTARLNANLTGYDVNDRGHGIIDAYDAVQLASNVDNVNKHLMYDSWDVTTPGRDLGWWCYDNLTFTVSEPSPNYGINLREIDYHYRHPLGIGNTDYRLLYRIGARHVWIDDTYYDLGNDMHKYLFAGPRIYERGGGYVDMGAIYKIDNVLVWFLWSMHVEEMWLWLYYDGGSSWRTLIYFDTDVWDTTNYPYLPEGDVTIYYEGKVIGDLLLNVRDLDHTEYLQIDPYSLDNPVMWVLRYDYSGNNPDTAQNDQYTYDRNIIVYYQGTSNFSGPWIYRETDSLPEPNPPPATPFIPKGPTSGFTNETYSYTTNTTDQEEDSIHYQFDWDDETRTWTGWYASGENASAPHDWSSSGTYYVRVRAQDSNDAWSDWSQSLAVTIRELVCAMKPKIEEDFYMPNATTTHLKIEMLFDNQNLTGDQTGPTSPYSSMDTYPDGIVDMRDIRFISRKFGSNEGDPDWDYMADVDPDRTIDMKDIRAASNNFGKTGTYITDLPGVTIKFNTGEEISPDDDGFVTIPQYTTSFFVKRYGNRIGAMIIFCKQ